MRVKLIPTSRCELLGLPECLGRLFPEHDFESVAAREEPAGDRVPFDGFTSGRLNTSLLTTKLPSNLTKLVQQLASEVHPGRDGHAADLAVLLDDLELENADQPQVVVDAVRTAVKQHLEVLRQRESAAKAERVEQALRDRASFHLAAPMIEAWFFADQESLRLAGVSPSRLPPKLRGGADPEAFETDDPAFSLDDGTTCTAFHAQNERRRKPERLPWMLPERPELPDYRRERHPKAYLSWLCRDPAQAQHGSTYRESHGGAAALQALGWEQVLFTPAHARFARALVLDLADALGLPALTLSGGEEHPLLARSAAPRNQVLRNL